MNREELRRFLTDLQREADALLFAKSQDYAGEEDALGAFRRLAAVCGNLLRLPLTPSDMAVILLVLKLDRDRNLVGRSPTNESRHDTHLDGLNYYRLFAAVCAEEQGAAEERSEE